MITLANGVVKDVATGRIVANPGGGANAITPANASALARRRWDKQRRAFADGVIETIRDTGQMPPTDDYDAGAMQVIGSKAMQVLLDTDNARGFSELMKSITHTADWIPDRQQHDTTGDVAAMLGLSDADDMLLVIRRARQIEHDE